MPTASASNVLDRLQDLLPVTKTGKLSNKKPGPLTRDDAKALSAEIRRRQFPHLWLLVERVHEGGAQQVLGYSNWRDYTAKELDLSESRSFQLLDQAKIMRLIQQAGIEPLSIEPIPARVVAKLKHAHADVLDAAKSAQERGQDVHDALRALAQVVSPSAVTRARAPQPGEVLCPTCNGHGAVPELTARLWAKFADDLA